MSVQVSDQDWKALSDADRQSIQKIIGDNFEGETVEPAASITQVGTNNTCETACNIAEGAAISACNALGFPANLVCVAAAREAGKFCRSRC